MTELKKRLTAETEKLLNERITNEMLSSLIYDNMSNYCGSVGLFKAQDKYKQYADEERTHLRKLQDYIIDRNCCPELSVTYTNSKYSSLLDTLEKAYIHECSITKAYVDISTTIRNSKDEVTYNFLLWFVHEQIEEEAKFADTLQQAKLLGIKDDSCCKGIELMKLEELFAS